MIAGTAPMLKDVDTCLLDISRNAWISIEAGECLRDFSAARPLHAYGNRPLICRLRIGRALNWEHSHQQ
jgi:hypothetical protein